MLKDGTATRSCNDVGPTAFETLAIIGAGAWGTAFALTAHRAGRRARMPVAEAMSSLMTSDLRAGPHGLEDGARIPNPARPQPEKERISA